MSGMTPRGGSATTLFFSHRVKGAVGPGSLQGLEVLDQGHSLFFRQLVAKGMAALTHSDPRGVDDELGLKW